MARYGAGYVNLGFIGRKGHSEVETNKQSNFTSATIIFLFMLSDPKVWRCDWNVLHIYRYSKFMLMFALSRINLERVFFVFGTLSDCSLCNFYYPILLFN